MNFLLRTAFAATHRFWHIVFLFSFVRGILKFKIFKIMRKYSVYNMKWKNCIEIDIYIRVAQQNHSGPIIQIYF